MIEKTIEVLDDEHVLLTVTVMDGERIRSRRQYHLGTGTSRHLRQVRADAAGGTGNQHHAIGEGEVLGVMVSHR